VLLNLSKKPLKHLPLQLALRLLAQETLVKLDLSATQIFALVTLPFHAVLATYAISAAYFQQEDPTMGNQYMALFTSQLDNLARRYADTPAPQPMIANSRSSTLYAAGMGRLRYANTGGVVW
jgi:hypothetical protein